MKITRDSIEVGSLCERYRAAGLSVGLVPTMGALHEGHVSLVTRAHSECDRVVVSIFVNPTQFGPTEDLSSYPVTTEADLEACRGAGCDLVFLGDAADMYPRGFQTWVVVEDLSKPLCGQSRPTHFRGVATVVTQLLAIVRPHRAYFGKKDFQQLRVLSRMVEDLHLGVEIRPCETVREPDGLAMSSRNVYLDTEARQVATRLSRALFAARDLVLGGEVRVEEIRRKLLEHLTPGPELRLDYAEVLDATSLQAFPDGVARRDAGGIVVAVAARVGRARLIDNIEIPPKTPARSSEGY